MVNRFGQGGILDLVGQEINNFKVIERLVNRTSKSTGKEFVSWRCLCNCGKEFVTTTKQIRRKQDAVKSCGCLSFKNRFIAKLTQEVALLKKVNRLYIDSAKKRNIEWHLDEQYTFALFLKNCFYCGSPPLRTFNYIKGYKPIKVNGIDRVNNNLGYVADNVVTCCMICNRAKGNLTTQDFKQWIENLYFNYVVINNK